MSNNIYDFLKNSCLVLTPIIILIMAILNIFKVIDNEVSIAIMSAIETSLGTMVVISKMIYDGKNKNEAENPENNTNGEG
mgnify:CR=1 FL=1